MPRQLVGEADEAGRVAGLARGHRAVHGLVVVVGGDDPQRLERAAEHQHARHGDHDPAPVTTQAGGPRGAGQRRRPDHARRREIDVALAEEAVAARGRQHQRRHQREQRQRQGGSDAGPSPQQTQEDRDDREHAEGPDHRLGARGRGQARCRAVRGVREPRPQVGGVAREQRPPGAAHGGAALEVGRRDQTRIGGPARVQRQIDRGDRDVRDEPDGAARERAIGGARPLHHHQHAHQRHAGLLAEERQRQGEGRQRPRPGPPRSPGAGVEPQGGEAEERAEDVGAARDPRHALGVRRHRRERQRRQPRGPDAGARREDQQGHGTAHERVPRGVDDVEPGRRPPAEAPVEPVAQDHRRPPHPGGPRDRRPEVPHQQPAQPSAFAQEGMALDQEVVVADEATRERWQVQEEGGEGGAERGMRPEGRARSRRPGGGGAAPGSRRRAGSGRG